MKSFAHHQPQSLTQVVALLAEYGGRARLNAGGTDLLGVLKDDIHADYPAALVDLKRIPGLTGISVGDDGALTLGALTKLADVADSPLVATGWPALATAARAVATPQLRAMGTVGGNLCQEVRCWYYRYPRSVGGPIACLRKGAKGCPALRGDNRYHALVRAGTCAAVCPSDLAMALTALGATVTIAGAGAAGARAVPVEELYLPLGLALEAAELVTEVRVPAPAAGTLTDFAKFTVRESVDFAVVSLGSLLTVVDGVCTAARLALGGVAIGPWRDAEAEAALVGRPLDEATIAAVTAAVLTAAKPLPGNAYKLDIARTLVRRALASAGVGRGLS
jgi:xanthine dehydrogenase YagS FAD-binding subunit